MVCYSVLLASSPTQARFTLSPALLSYAFFFFFSIRSHGDTAGHIEAAAVRAVNASKQTYGLLMDLLRDNSTEEYIRNLTER